MKKYLGLVLMMLAILMLASCNSENGAASDGVNASPLAVVEESIISGSDAEEYQSRLETAISNFNSFDGSDKFRTDKNGNVQSGAELMPTDKYETPTYTPTTGEHPRILVTTDMLPKLRAVFEDPRYATMAEDFWEAANVEGLTGIMPKTGEVTHKNGTPNDTSDDYIYEVHSNPTILFQIEAKALAYLLTGDELYAYEAVYALKNAILTLRYWTSTQQDTYHAYASLMEIAAYVYDWCYDILDEEDKTQIIDGIRFYLIPYIEFDYPPSNMSAVSGHGTGSQMFRVWITLAAAVADERPDWWQFVGGRFYEEYIPVVNQMYASGYVPQGTNYGISKYGSQVLAAYMLETMGDDDAIDKNVSIKAPYYIFSMLLPNGNYFQTGDALNYVGHSPEGQEPIETVWVFVAAALTDDPIILSYAYDYTNGATSYDTSYTGHLTPALMAILIAACDADMDDAGDTSLGLIEYCGFPGGQTNIRNSWDADAVALYMKVGDRTMANHDHFDSGTFQIYYKGLLAGDSGYYDGPSYGENHWTYYQITTVAHNGLLVYDPLKATDKYYSGGQVRRKEAGSLIVWNEGQYDLAKITGHAEGYSQNGSLAEYAYIAGDMTNAYDADSVNYIARHMLTVMQNDDPDVPMIMFIYDDIESDNVDSIKKFLLHTVNEPTIDTETNIVTAIEGDGKLVLVPLSGVEKAELIGGEGKEFWVGADSENGYNVADGVPDKNGAEPGLGHMWGRVEFSASGEATNRMLNAIYVTDKESTASVDFKLIETDEVIGAQTETAVAIFMKSREYQATSFTFTASGEGLRDYYIAGVKAGTWEVSLNGTPIGTTYSAEGGAFLKFTAPAGEITIAPKAVTERYDIDYNLFGGELSGLYPRKYTYGVGVEEFPVPTHPSGYEFLGWYSDALFENEITSIGSDASGTVSLYAKWKKLPTVYANYDGSHKTGLTASKLNLVTLENGDNVFEFYSTNTSGPIIKLAGIGETYGVMYGDKKAISFTVSISRVPNYDTGDSYFRLVSANGKSDSYIFKISEEGVLTLGKTNIALGTLTEEMQTFRFVLDFEDGTLAAYDANGFVIDGAKVDYQQPDGYATMEEWRLSFINYDYVFNWRLNTAGRLYVSDIIVAEGNTHLSENAETARSINYVLRGGEFLEEAPTYYLVGTGLAELPIPTHPLGYEFLGWYSDEALTDKVTSISSTADTAIILYAKWDRATIVYNTDDGNLPSDAPAYYVIGTGIATLPTPVSPDGYEFLGWYTDAELTNKITEIGADAIDTVTLYAKWNRLTVTYSIGNAKLPAEVPVYFAAGVGLATLPTPIHDEGFTFIGWYTEPTCENLITAIGTDVTENITLYAKWQAPPIVYLQNDGSTTDGITPAFREEFNGKFEAVDTNEDGTADALEWSITDGGSQTTRPTLKVTGSNGYNVMNGTEHVVSFTISLSSIEGCGMLNTTFRIAGKAIGGIINIFKINDGKIRLSGDSTNTVLATISAEMQTLRIAVDFDQEKVFAYDAEGNVLASFDLPVPAEYKNGEEFRAAYTESISLFNWYVNGHDGSTNEDDSVRRYGYLIGDVRIEEGNVFVRAE